MSKPKTPETWRPTGLRDRNGILIHEGDIVRIFSRARQEVVGGRVIPAKGSWLVEDTLTGEFWAMPDQEIRVVVLGPHKPWEGSPQQAPAVQRAR